MTIVLVLNVVLIAALVVVGLTTHSIGVLAEGGDYLGDAAAIGVALFAIWLSQRSATTRRPDGYPNATNVAALLNGGWLLVLCILIAVSASYRLLHHSSHVNGLPVLVVSGIAAVLMLVGALILGGDAKGEDDDGDLNMRAVLLDTAADAAAAAGVAVTGGVIYATGGWNWLDPAVALVISVVIGFHAVALVREILDRRIQLEL